LLKVALDIHQILMLKNKIYNYFFNEIIKNFIIILFTFTVIAWVVRAVNFLDLMVEDGFASSVYFKYSLLNITAIISRFVPLAFLLSLTISIVKFERQQELLILWTTGLSKIKVVNVFLLIGLCVTFFQLFLSLIINPFLLNKSRFILNEKDAFEVNTVLKSNDFSDAFTNLTFYIDNKNINNELLNIFIKDSSGNLTTGMDNVDDKKDSTIIAEKGFVTNGKLILYNGMMQTLNEKNEIKNIFFEKTELALNNISTRTIKLPKIQETSTYLLFRCIYEKNSNLEITNCSKEDGYKSVAIQDLARRVGAPLYIPLVSIITSFLLFYKKEKTYNFLKKYVLFILSFIILIFAEILLKYTGLSIFVAASYFAVPITISFIFYAYLFKKIKSEKI
jgi:lipopolysaccharide export system permease protein